MSRSQYANIILNKITNTYFQQDLLRMKEHASEVLEYILKSFGHGRHHFLHQIDYIGGSFKNHVDNSRWVGGLKFAIFVHV